MELVFKVDTPENFSTKEKEEFLRLLIEQDQVANPSIEKIEGCHELCLVTFNQTRIGIGALKQVYLSPFDYAQIPELKYCYNLELGYLYVHSSLALSYRGLGIGKTITRLLLKAAEGQRIFATTENSEKNAMKIILEQLGFEKTGRDYKGNNTGKVIGLFLRNPKE